MILYSQCWEDPLVARKALLVKGKRVLSIASGGENVFALLLDKPKSIVAIDDNLEQLYLLEFKAMAIAHLSHQECLSLLGYWPGQRILLYKRIRKYLRAPCAKYWDAHLDAIKLGVVHFGRFERYLELFRRIIIPLTVSKKTMNTHLSLTSLEDQKRYYVKKWAGLRWKLLFRIFFSKYVLMRGRDKKYFVHLRNRNVAAEFYARTFGGFTKTPIADNYFVRYILTGRFSGTLKGHPVLNKKNFEIIKQNISKIHLLHDSVLHHLATSPNRYDAFNLSDVFEVDSQAVYEQTLKLIAKHKGARLLYWNNLVPRNMHSVNKIVRIKNHLKDHDRVFFYGDCILEKVL